MRLLKRGSSGEAVRNLQRDLIRLGYRMKPDGRFGPVTERAVRRFQSVAEIEVDGVVGPVTAKAVQDALVLRAKEDVPPAGPIHPSLRPLIVVLDVQHIGKKSQPADRGAKADGLVECVEVEAYFRAAEKALLGSGHKVVWGGVSGLTGDYHERIAKANAASVDLYLAGHLNAFDGRASYSLVRYLESAPPHTAAAARAMADAFSAKLGTESLVAGLRDDERGAVCLRGAKMPALLLEPLFMDHPAHAALLRADGHERIGRAIAAGVAAFAAMA